MDGLGIAAAAEALRNGELTAVEYATGLLDQAERYAGLHAFVTIEPERVLSAAAAADRARADGAQGALLGVPLGVKDSFLTRDLPTSIGTAVLRNHRPAVDADAVTALRAAGAIVFGKNNLAEMSFGLTGENPHHGQVRNPYDVTRITGGSSSGAGAAVAAGIVPGALAGDTIGSIRVPAALCGVVGFKPTPLRWSSVGAAPISTGLDATGLVARTVEDCVLMDAVLKDPVLGTPEGADPAAGDLEGVRLAVAPAYFLAGVDPEVELIFLRAVRRLEAAGAEIVEVDLGAEFGAVADRATWPIFFGETRPAIAEFLRRYGVPASFEQIHAAMGDHIRGRWARLVVEGAPDAITAERYAAAVQTARPELRWRLDELAFEVADALVFPTTACAAPRIAEQWSYSVAGQPVTDTYLARNTHLANTAGLPGISLPMGLTAEGLPVGIELDGRAYDDVRLLDIARRVELVLGHVPPPALDRVSSLVSADRKGV
jgi:Asp-tRNA(Asn)/Glu-tRNA(Gln) amidotransferase A subunit family amidase